MRPTLALALATAATLTSPVVASSHGHTSHGQGLVKRHAFGGEGMVRRMVRRVRRGESAAVLSLPSNSSTSSNTTSSSSTDKKKQYTSTAIWWAEAGWIGSCGEVISDTDPVLALPLSLYPTPSTPSPLCGQTLTLRAPSTGKSITARVVGASDREDYTAMSRSAFEALGGDLEGGEVGVVMEFVDNGVSIPSAASSSAVESVQSGAGKVVAAASSSANSPAAAAQTTTTQAAKTSPSAAQTTTQAPTTQAKQATTTTTTTTTSSWDSASAASKSSADAAWASSSSAAAAAAASKSSADSAWASSSSAAAYKMWASSSSSAAAAAASKSSADAAWASSSSAAAAAASKSSADAAWASSSSVASAAKATQTSSSGSSGGSSGGKVYTGGIATFFYQNGVAGNCGQVNSDDSYIVALPTSTYAGGSHCGQSVKITRSDTGQSITAKVADSCPTCNNASCLDLSVGAYKALGGTDSMGVFDITWQFV